MKRFDRATYVIFLLVLLADVARTHASVPIGGGAGGGLILSAANQLQVSPTGRALRVLRRPEGAPGSAGSRSYRLSFSGWSRTFSDHLSGESSAVMRSVLAPAPGVGLGSRFVSVFSPALPSLAVFGFTGSPAP